MKIRKEIAAIVVAAMMFPAMGASCARQPSSARSEKIIKSHFKKYGKKFKQSDYNSNPVEKVEVISQQEIHKKLVAIEAFITLKDGTVKLIHATVERGPVGWRFVSWENAG
ncbi:MAG: hypothetical protein BWY40_01066 [bacterium ADurb.Bin270]|nr:hypothetical protein [Myxococcales bacterium]OQA60075.1 MAG: hypothetical protein BWY40_01066 [bacterium ADurb.Bin270]HQG13476.1 hypothetical protein [bacterium]HQH80152.1 hypothetical protein [bacterium]